MEKMIKTLAFITAGVVLVDLGLQTFFNMGFLSGFLGGNTWLTWIVYGLGLVGGVYLLMGANK